MVLPVPGLENADSRLQAESLSQRCPPFSPDHDQKGLAVARTRAVWLKSAN